jgi:hypothetical protein
MERTVVVLIYSSATSLAGFAWISDVLSVERKLMVTGMAVAMLIAGFLLQAKWKEDM